jgi:hypothetical protein
MKIIDIQEREDGTVMATIADENDNVVGYTIYTEDSVPRPKLGEINEGGIIRRVWTWITGG